MQKMSGFFKGGQNVAKLDCKFQYLVDINSRIGNTTG